MSANEVKTVKVDNWGSFFLQKLQNFFNKTDYCDMTLQFRDNSQLKVHRLVLSACTDYFNILEATNDCADDVLLMPRDLQADVVVPIVNFMYTGTLEFEVRMYERLLKTARDMKMSVLLKLLEAHRRAIPQKPAPIVLNRGVAGRPAMRGGGYVSASTRGRAVGRPATNFYSKTIKTEEEEVASEFERLRRAGNENPAAKRPNASISHRSSSPPQKKPNLQDVKDFTEAARLRKQLNEDGDDDVGADYDVDDTYSHSSGEETPRQSMSLLSTGSNKSPRVSLDSSTTTATVTLHEVPGQKMDHAKIISEVMKKYPHLLKSNKNIKLKITQKTPGVSGTSITVRAETSNISPAAASATASTSSSSATPVGRALMASKQQHLTATTTTTGRGGKSIVTSSRSLVAAKPAVAAAQSIVKPAAVTPAPAIKGNRIDSRTMHRLIAMGAENMSGPWLCLRCGVDGKPIGIPTYRAFRKHLINTHNEKIDPRLCEHCGHKSSNRQELYHHVQVTHNIMPPQGVAFPTCKKCKFVAVDKTSLLLHEKEKGHGPTVAAASTATTRSKAAATATESGDKGSGEFECEECGRAFTTRKALGMHRIAKHRLTRGRRAKLAESSEETEPSEAEDEVVEEDDAEEEEENDDDQVDFDPSLPEEMEYVPQKVTSSTGRKIKILSNVAVKGGKSRSSEAESLTTVATGIATSLGLGADDDGSGAADNSEYNEEIVDETRLIEEALANVHGEKQDDSVETKFLAEDGSELQLTAAQKAELMSQLEANGTTDGEGVVMMYENEEEVAAAAADDAAAAGNTDGPVGAEVKSSGQVIKDGDDVLMVYGGPRSKAAVKKEVAEVVKEDAAAVAATLKVEVSVEDDCKMEEDVEKEKSSLIKELEGDWTDGEEKATDEEPQPEPKEEKPVAVVIEEVTKGESKSEDVVVDSKTEDTAVPVDTEEVKKSSTETKEAAKKDPDTLADFMNDWQDE